MDNRISENEWESYLEELYRWIQEKYELFEQNQISQDEYNEHLDYYMKEKERIEQIIENADEIDPSENPKGKVLTQEKIEEYFGVSLQEEISKIDDEGDQQVTDPVNQGGSDLQATDVWEFMKFNDKENFQPTELYGEENKLQEIKILLIGDSAVGRTSLRRAWMGKHFIESHLTTIGASIEKKQVNIYDQPYEVTLTDLGGQDFYSGLRRNFYRNIDGAILVFDLTRPDTFRRLDFWIKEMYREIKRLVPFILVGNKRDSRNRKIPEKHGIRASAQFSRTTLPKFRVRYMETSAKSGENVNEIFETICREVLELKNQG